MVVGKEVIDSTVAGDESRHGAVPQFLLLGALLALLVASIAAKPILSYYENVDSKFGGAVGILLGYFGLVLSVAGFGLTWWQIARTRKSTDAVRSAIKKLKNDFSSFDMLLEIRTAEASAEESRRHLASPNWAAAIGSLHRLRSSLVKMTAVKASLETDAVDRLKDFTGDTVDAIQGLEAKNRDDTVAIDFEALTTSLLELDEFLIIMEYSLKDKVSGR